MPSGGNHDELYEGPLEAGERRDLGEVAAEANRDVLLILAALERWGDAFRAYLLLPDIDLRDPEIEEHFIDVYGGYYESRQALVDAQLESLGWTDAVNDFKAEQGIWEDDLLWNYDALWAHCCDVYSMSERLGGVHAFLR